MRPSIVLLVKGRYTKPRIENGLCKAHRFQPKPYVGFRFATNQSGISQEQLDIALGDLRAQLRADMEKAENGLRTEMEKDSENWGPERIKNVASQVLLFALGDQPRKQRPTVYARFAPIADSREFKDLAFRMFCYREKRLQLAQQFDIAIYTRNQTVHLSNTKDLEDAVNGTLELLNRRTNLKAKYPVEFRVLNNFRHFKAVFPHNFGP